MGVLTVTAKGQVTLRKELLDHLGIGPGEQISVDKLPDGRIEVRAARAGDISAVFGLLSRKGQPVLSLDDIAEISREGWAGQPPRRPKRKK
jgi:AbrB family looped-hinge helix DNA binding protein